MSWTTREIAEWIDGEVRGDGALVVDDANALPDATASQIAFATDARSLPDLERTSAGAVIVARALAESLDAGREWPTLVLVDDPYGAFLQVIATVRGTIPRVECGVSPAANVDATATIGANTNVHPGATVGPGAVVGENCDVHPGVCIGAGCRVGDNTVLHPNVVLYPNVTIGDRCIVHASAVLGCDGYGYRQVDGRHVKVPQLGTLRIEDDVEIGAGTTIDRASITETVIGAGTKIDNQVHIAHNCRLGRHNLLISQVGFAGSVTTGDYVVCAGQVGVVDHVTLGTGSMIGAQAGVSGDTRPGVAYWGYPARPAAEAKKAAMATLKLPAMRKTMRELESRMTDLHERMGELASRTQRDAA